MPLKCNHNDLLEAGSISGDLLKLPQGFLFAGCVLLAPAGNVFDHVPSLDVLEAIAGLLILLIDASHCLFIHFKPEFICIEILPIFII